MFSLKGALRAIFFAFAIEFSTFNQFCAARQVSAFTASRLAANYKKEKMNCIFCDINVLLNSIEHIVPESLGNEKYVLQDGSICRTCNNLFSKFEDKALTKTILGMERARLGIITKKLKPAISKTGAIQFTGDSEFRKNYINVQGISKDDLKNFNPENNTYQMTVKGFDKSEMATSKLILKIGYEAIFQSQKKIFNKYNFSSLTNHLTNIENDNWPFMTTKLKLSPFISIPRFCFKHDLKKIECELLYSEIDNETLLFNFKYGGASLLINLLGRNANWADQYIKNDKNSAFYPIHLKRTIKDTTSSSNKG